MISKQARKDIFEHALSEYPRESCGVIVDGEYIACENIAKDIDQFRINPRDLVKARKVGKIRAYVHSHPDGTTKPSIPDKLQMAYNNLPWIITNGTSLATHKPKPFSIPLLGRDYYHGFVDCYTLVKDYYKRELDITLRDYAREDAWWEDANSKPLYLDNFANEGFVEVTDIKKHDIILCRLGRTEHVNHAVIFMGEGDLKSEKTDKVIGDMLIIHHPYGGNSVRDIYGEQWHRRTAKIIRHKGLM